MECVTIEGNHYYKVKVKYVARKAIDGTYAALSVAIIKKSTF